ncbi:MAG: hypothetical protein M3R72_08655 [Bacteroidota bacterium]|nr:hypothetical protein [Bacteroidota bacterium]
MSESFFIPLDYGNQTFELPAQLITTAYSYYIEVEIEDTKVNFERDDEGKFRAIAPASDSENRAKTNFQLLQAIAGKLEEILS